MSNSLHRKGEDSEGYHENLKYRDQEFEKIASAAAGARKSCYSAEATLRLRQILLIMDLYADPLTVIVKRFKI